jgi:hypothetical protein
MRSCGATRRSLVETFWEAPVSIMAKMTKMANAVRDNMLIFFIFTNPLQTEMQMVSFPHYISF